MPDERPLLNGQRVSGPTLVIPNRMNAPTCRLCPREAALIVRPSGTFTTAYAYCARCVDTALERFDLGHGS